MRIASVRLGIVSAAVAVALTYAVPAAAQDRRWHFDAAVGPSFGNVGTTFLASGDLAYDVNDRLRVAGEVGVQPHAPFEKAEEIVTSLPGMIAASEFRVNGYHANVNASVYPVESKRLRPYVTAGLGSFTADTIGRQELVDGHVEERRRQTDFATNIGAGITYRLTDWLGVSGDYRTFFVHRTDDTRAVHRFTTGLTFQIR